MSRYKFEVNGKTYGVITRYNVPKWLEAEYVEHDVLLHIEGKDSILIPFQSHCDLCKRDKSVVSHKKLIASPYEEINHKLGYPGRICLDCLYYVERMRGIQWVPLSSRYVLESGFKPSQLDNFFSI